ncbi:hypothetical protein K461DRAFT_273901 [Myriangium duriaei CBS 260.36]|uniref:DUF7624 domain-containing protein n=1 Tax=Myriangium duriaei CBS 260.36 TaxID=1168546 RepID=A0A9P4J9S6_9PEZI|nr:hypothetical protein K461DRAFT_273901 [Myriangium duriaei CBS 260.36]
MAVPSSSPSGPSPLPSPRRVDNTSDTSDATKSPEIHAEMSPRNQDYLVPPSPYPQHVDPSPIESTGTDGTDIDDEAQDGASTAATDSATAPSPATDANPGPATSPVSPNSLAKLNTTAPPQKGSGWEDTPSSVIFVPQGFKQFNNKSAAPAPTDLVEVHLPERIMASPVTPDAANGPDDERLSVQTLSPASDHRHQARPPSIEITRQDSVAESDSSKSTPHISSQHATDLSFTSDTDNHVQIVNVDGDLLARMDAELHTLRQPLSQCWTLCCTLENLSASFRNRVFSNTPHGMLQEKAWDSCWNLCKNLYEYLDDPVANMDHTVELCREFTRARFAARSKSRDSTDAMLRVSFEMNEHLYNIRDTSLPWRFVKRTMEFHVAFCHRMMKQRSTWPEETDALLKAGWSLAESLYSLQQSSADETANQEDLIMTAVSACWELSDLFRSGWIQFRPERSTPRANQTKFLSRTRRVLAASEGRVSSLSNRTYHDAASFPLQEPPLPPETPVTIFDDITTSASPEATNVPNILVLGPDHPSSRPTGNRTTFHDRWSSNASMISERTGGLQSSQRTSSTNAANKAHNGHLFMLRVLLVRTAINHGFKSFPSANASTGSPGRLRHGSLAAFVGSLPENAFGDHASKLQLLDTYKVVISQDDGLRDISKFVGKSYPAIQIARAVTYFSSDDPHQYGWMDQLYDHVVGGRAHEMRNERLELDL